MATQNTTSGTTPPATVCAEEYVVKKGDSFYLISHKLGVPLRDLLAANRDIHPARLMVGDVLCIPRPATEGAPGETAGGITNGTTSGAPGTTGTTPGTTGTTPTPPSPPTSPTPAPPGDTSGTSGSTPTPPSTTDGITGSLQCPLDEQHTVQSGQTVADLQLRNLVSRNTLAKANPTVNLEQLTAGQVLCIPKENIPCDLPPTYTLGENDTLESVAIRFHLPVGALLRANPCLAPQDFECSTTIVLPS